MSKDKNWIEDIIPHVETLVEKEKQHLNFLKKTQRGFIDRKMGIGALVEIKQFINNSEAELEHFELRLKEYKEYYAKQ